MMKNGTAYGFVVLAILSVLIISSTASACVNSTDSFATEVLLSKPGISYNLSGMIESDDVIVKTKEIPVGSPEGIPATLEPHRSTHKNITTIDSSGVVGEGDDCVSWEGEAQSVAQAGA